MCSFASGGDGVFLDATGTCGLFTSESGYHRSDDDGNSWEHITDGLPSHPLAGVAADASGAYLLTADGAVIRLAEDGELVPLPPVPSSEVFHVSVSNGTALAGTSWGVFGFDGMNWVPVGLQGLRVRRLAVDSDGTIYAASSAGVMRAAPFVLSGEQPPAGGFESAITSIHPNPAGARATVAFTLAAPGEARLAVYDLLGRRVALRAEGAMEAGRHVVPLALDGVASGVYVVELVAGEVRQTQRLTVVR